MSRLTGFDRERVSGSDLVWEKFSLRALDEKKRHRLLAMVLLLAQRKKEGNESLQKKDRQQLSERERERESSTVNLSTSERCRLKQRGLRTHRLSLRRRIQITNHTTSIKALTMEASRTTAKASSLRWQILRQALLSRPPPLIPEEKEEEEQSETSIKSISRKASQGFNLIPCHVVDDDAVLASGSLMRRGHATEARMCYTLPVDGAPRIFLTQRVDERADLGDFETCNRYNIDNTGLVCHWPSEDVLAYFCLSQADMFRYKRVIELGSGYGLAGLVIAAITEASEVVISDGNPQVVDYIQRNIDANTGAFGATRVNSMTLHWDQEEISNLSNAFDVIIASDCTFFKEFHNGLARIIKLLLNKAGPSQAIFFSPKRGNSLDKFLETINQNGLFFSVTENYDAEVWKRHQAFMDCKNSWTSYEQDHCYPVMVRITL